MDTVALWIGVHSHLQVTEDELIVAAVQNEVQKALQMATKLAENNLGWKLKTSFHAVIEKVKVLLSSMKNLNVATAYANWVTQQLPLVEEKVLFSLWAVDLAEQWKKNSENKKDAQADASKAADACKKLRKLSQQIGAKKILTQYGKLTSKVLNLISRPSSLVKYLFEQYRQEHLQLELHHVLDVKQLVDEIARIFEINLENEKKTILKSWINSMPVNSPDIFAMIMENTFLQRFIYLCYPPTNELNSEFLQNDSQEPNPHDCLIQYLCLKGLLVTSSILPSDQLLHYKNRFLYLHYICQLQAMQFPMHYTLNNFTGCDKNTFATKLWKGRLLYPQLVSLTSEFLMDFKITNQVIWKDIIQHLMNFEMTNNLETVFDYLLMFMDSTFWESDTSNQAWKLIFSRNLSIDNTSSDRNIIMKNGYNLAVRIYRCPVELPFNSSLWDLCFEINLPAVAMAYVIHSDESVEKYLKNISAEVIDDIIDNLHEFKQHNKELPQTLQVVEKLMNFCMHHEDSTTLSRCLKALIDIFSTQSKKSTKIYCKEK